jgi:hypothetical protein
MEHIDGAVAACNGHSMCSCFKMDPPQPPPPYTQLTSSNTFTALLNIKPSLTGQENTTVRVKGLTFSLCKPCRQMGESGGLYSNIYNKIQLYTAYLYLETALHVSGSTSTHHQERIQMYLQHLVFVRPLQLQQ